MTDAPADAGPDVRGRAPALEVRGLVKRYGAVSAVDGIDLSVESGTVCGVVGPNGAGKTTLFRMVLGLLAPDAGDVRLFGRPAGPNDVAARDGVGGFVEEPRFYPYLSARRAVELLARLDRAPAAMSPADALAAVGLTARADDKVRGFSTGMKQRVGIAAALVRASRLLVLDEPTIGLDPAGAAAIHRLVRRIAAGGATVLLSSHNMTEVAEICERVVIVSRGAVVWDGTMDLLREEAPVAAYRLRTTDDAAAEGLGRELGIEITPGASGALVVHADDDLRDKYLKELAMADVAVRRLEPDISPLDALFTSLTGGGGEAA